MTADFDPFLRAVLAAPDDPLPRLLAADWAAEQRMPGVAALLKTKRLPVDDWTARACRALVALNLSSRFVRDVCRGAVVYEECPLVSALAWTEGECIAVGGRPRDRLSPKQYLTVWRMVRQHAWRMLDPGLVVRAYDLLPPATAGAP